MDWDVHDSRLLGFEVDEIHHRIVVHTVRVEREREQYVDVVFDDVLGYRLDGDACGESILLDLIDLDVWGTAGNSAPQEADTSGPWFNLAGADFIARFNELGGTVYRLMLMNGPSDSFIAARSYEFLRVESGS